MIRWHRSRAWGSYPFWFAEIDGIRVAEAVNTSVTGTDNYPWEWHLTAEGLPLRDPAHADAAWASFGNGDTLRTIKGYVAEQFGETPR